MSSLISPTGIIFILTVFVTILITYIARKHDSGRSDILADQKLNKWLIGLSAGATANSGFVVTGAVGLGYLYGAQWLWLPIAWLLGDLVFWKFFPHRLNDLGRRVSARTITDLIATDKFGIRSRAICIFVGILILLCLGGYVTGQWLAGQKFLSGAFGLTPTISTILLGTVIIGYTIIGGFRGSIYADSFMAVIRLIITTLCLFLIASVAIKAGPEFHKELTNAGPNFLKPINFTSLWSFLAFIVGFAFAGFGFGLGQPQVTNRYLSGITPQETQSAWWIYLGFVQFTWIAMTVFGIILRGLMPEIDDPEAGLSIFFATHFGAIITGLIVADIFATISATTNSLLISMSQSLKNDLIETSFGEQSKFPLAMGTLILGAVTIAASLVANQLGGTVFSLAITSASFLAAALAPVVLLKSLRFNLGSLGVFFTIAIGFTVAILWKIMGPSGTLNEAAPGIIAGSIVGYLFSLISSRGGENENNRV